MHLSQYAISNQLGYWVVQLLSGSPVPDNEPFRRDFGDCEARKQGELFMQGTTRRNWIRAAASSSVLLVANSTLEAPAVARFALTQQEGNGKIGL